MRKVQEQSEKLLQVSWAEGKLSGRNVPAEETAG